MANDQNRPIDHAGMEVLAGTECTRLLQDHRVGRVAFLEAGEPWVLPVVYRLDGNHIAFRSAVGAKLDLAERGDPIAFEIDGWDEEARVGWSVLVRGIPHAVTDEDEVARLDALHMEQWVQGPYPMQWIVIIPDEITGRRISSQQPA
jgi:uncharacterized protein